MELKNNKFKDLVTRQPMDIKEEEEAIEITWILKQLFESDPEYQTVKKVDEEKRCETHLKLVKSEAFASFAKYAKSKGASCNMDIYHTSFAPKKKNKWLLNNLNW